MEKYLLIPLAVFSVIGAAAAVKDKRAAVRGERRVPEARLLLYGLLGGAAAEFIVMAAIRHKTRKKKFMIGLPVVALLHFALFLVLATR
ncbi:MAG: DUF1294 domain-containing protein [Clostridia bacterium]|nr:DUF1294 domain-containing protein [Clostridia bacterium]